MFVKRNMNSMQENDSLLYIDTEIKHACSASVL